VKGEVMVGGLVSRLRGFFGVEMTYVTSGVLSDKPYPEYEGRSLQIKVGKWIIEFSLLREKRD